MTAPADDHTPQALEDDNLLTVDGLALRVQVSARRRRFALTVEADAGLTLHAPQGRSAADAADFVRAHRTWLVSRRALRERARPLNPAKRLVEGEVFRYLGRTYRLAVVGDGLGDDRVRLVAGRLIISRALAEDMALGRAALVDWYCRAGHAWVTERLQPWAARMSVPEPVVDVCDLGSRWGAYRSGEASRASDHMSLGWPLFQLPMHLIDYVIAHELAHARIPGHGVRFWRLVGQALPEYEERRMELDELGRRMWMGEIV
ncbi:M48 family metallopeptidase [Nonomuraea sp. K274]|uniref:M48 family metallopeptidase n=1 Tax=Nonomuraea cypriaca TaxID=1187855 RepID=A0A931A6W8_9ACTN|nr:SprT family zinc-dependent metalloprotease [Nonomuraea cypriaca]MBF8186268.1 M48 family metallopeptidase [Nonomuraea cypriaca]